MTPKQMSAVCDLMAKYDHRIKRTSVAKPGWQRGIGALKGGEI